MIKINGEENILNIGKYPDGTPAISIDYEALRFSKKQVGFVEVMWCYENMEEFFIVSLIAKYLQEVVDRSVFLYMPYVPNARMDRANSREDMPSMKYFAELINSLNFESVVVLDPHSIVVQNTIKNIIVKTPERLINKALDKCGSIDLLFYPDHGSESRYSPIQEDLNLPYLSGYKQRDWKTGKIEKLQILGDTSQIKGKNILIVDDICSKGGTFLYAAQALKGYGAADIYLYVTHCESTIFQGEMIKSGLIKKIYTTNSIYRNYYHPLIKVFDLEEM